MSMHYKFYYPTDLTYLGVLPAPFIGAEEIITEATPSAARKRAMGKHALSEAQMQLVLITPCAPDTSRSDGVAFNPAAFREECRRLLPMLRCSSSLLWHGERLW